MSSKLLNIGFGNTVASDKVIAIISPESAPVKRLKDSAEESGLLIDATCGRRTRSVIVCTSRHIVLSALQPETLAARLTDKDGTVFEPDNKE